MTHNEELISKFKKSAIQLNAENFVIKLAIEYLINDVKTYCDLNGTKILEGKTIKIINEIFPNTFK
jgi:hypothetical protein